MASSPKVDALTEAISTQVGGFDPESVFPDLDSFLENFYKVFESASANLAKFAARVEDMPVNAAVPEGIKDMIPTLDGLADAAREVFSTFKRRHEQEREQHLNPRPNEKAWNTAN
jgi:hypothetical protein